MIKPDTIIVKNFMLLWSLNITKILCDLIVLIFKTKEGSEKT